MGSASRQTRFAALAALMLVASCRVHFDSVRSGGTWTPADVEAIAVGRDDRGAVLERMGPPDVLFYTINSEVFVYRRGAHRGTDLRFLIPNVAFNLARPAMSAVHPEQEVHEEFGESAPTVALTRTIIDRLFSFFVPISSDEALALQGTRLRWDVARVVLDRTSLVTQHAELFAGIDDASAAALLDEALLLDSE